MIRDLYALHDSKPSGAFLVDPLSAHDWNNQGYGIYQTVNQFSGSRKQQDLTQLLSWYVEIDDLPKHEQLALIEQSPVPPNLIIESKRGFQIYWNCREARVEFYKPMLKRLRRFFLADDNAADISRILRAPNYYHMKDPTDPFMVSTVWELEGTYSEKLMMWNFPDVDEETQNEPVARQKLCVDGNDFWERVYNLDCQEGLLRLSGRTYVNLERYDFKPVSRGHLNILVNGKSTSCFIDSNKRIGSSAKGGPTLFQWLKWYGIPNREAVRILKDLFPELIQ